MNDTHSITLVIQGFFLQYLPVIRGLSTETALAYRDAIKLLLCFAADRLKRDVDRLTLEDLDPDLVVAFLNHIEEGRGCCVRTRNARFAAICTFFDYVGRQLPALLPQCHAVRNIPKKHDEHRSIDYFDAGEVQAMIAGIDLASRTGLRDKALLLFLFNTGARAQECVNVCADDLRLDKHGQVKIMGKRRKERVCPLWPETVDAIRAYTATEPGQDEGGRSQVFRNASGKPMTRFGVRYIVKKLAYQAAEKCPSLRKKKVGPHTWRHSTAMHLLQADNDINMVSYWLGHATTNTTHMYVEIDIEMKRKMLTNAQAPKGSSRRPRWQKPKTIEWLNDLSQAPCYVQ